eukprot:363967-Chlamydomonas_euryale.AAC.1
MSLARFRSSTTGLFSPPTRPSRAGPGAAGRPPVAVGNEHRVPGAVAPGAAAAAALCQDEPGGALPPSDAPAGRRGGQERALGRSAARQGGLCAEGRCAQGAAGRAPLQQFNKQLAARAAQRAAMRSAADVSVGRGNKRKGRSGGSDEDEDADSEDDAAAAAALRRRGGGDGNEDDEAVNAGPSKKKAKAASVAAALSELGGDGGDGGDVIREYQLSDDESEDDGNEGAGAEMSEDDDDGNGDGASEEDGEEDDDGSEAGAISDSDEDGEAEQSSDAEEFVDMMRGTSGSDGEGDGDDDDDENHGGFRGGRGGRGRAAAHVANGGGRGS